jgi:hypothetical protein
VKGAIAAIIIGAALAHADSSLLERDTTATGSTTRRLVKHRTTNSRRAYIPAGQTRRADGHFPTAPRQQQPASEPQKLSRTSDDRVAGQACRATTWIAAPPPLH